MTLNELNQYASLQRECFEHYQNVITLYEKSIGISATIGDGRHGSGKSDKPAIAVNVVDEKAKIEQLQAVINKQTHEIIDYIVNIEDSLTRRIFNYRFVYGYEWEVVAEKLGTSSYSAKHICYRYLERH